MTYKITISPEAFSQVQSLRNFARFGVAVAQAMDSTNQDVVGKIKDRISGPGVRRGKLRVQGENIGVDTGTLRRSIQRTRALVVGNGSLLEVRSSVGSNVRSGGESVVYAAIHEYGGDVQHPARSARVRRVRGRFAKKKRYEREVERGRHGPGTGTFAQTIHYKSFVQHVRARPYVSKEIEAAVADGRYSRSLDERIRRIFGGLGNN